MAGGGLSGDPWQRAPTGELGDQLLPRWFVILAVVMVPTAVGVLAAALLLSRPTAVPVAERRPVEGVGELVAGESEPVVYERACPALTGVRVAGGPADRASLRGAIAGLCNVQLEQDITDRLTRFATAGGVVRFAVFDLSGVDVTSDLETVPPHIYPNLRFTRTDPLWIGPLVVHETTFLDFDRRTAEGALEARRAERRTCALLLSGRTEPQGCRDAAELLELADPLAALRQAGYR